MDVFIINPIMNRDGWFCVGGMSWVEYKGKILVSTKNEFDDELHTHMGLWDCDTHPLEQTNDSLHKAKIHLHSIRQKGLKKIQINKNKWNSDV